MKRIDLRKCVLATDIDFTVLKFIRDIGLQNQGVVVGEIVGKHPDIVGLEIEAISAQLIGHNVTVKKRVEEYFDAHIQCAILKLDERHWSMAAKVLMYLEDAGYDPRKHYATAVRAEHAFWAGVRDHSVLYEDTQYFCDFFRDRAIPMFGITSSDARTEFQRLSLDDAVGRIAYDVERSIARKYDRFEPSGIYGHIPREDVIVADPWHKHDLRLWESRVFPRYLDRPDRSHWIMVGDTRFDMVAGKEAGIGTRILIKRHKDTKRVREATHIVYSLTEATRLIQDLFG